MDAYHMVWARQGNLLSDNHVAHACCFRGDLVLSMEVYQTLDEAMNELE